MATNATIAKINRNGDGLQLHLVYDGYPTWAGIKLLLHYSDETRIDELMELGDIYTLGDSPEHVPSAFINDSWQHDQLGHLTRALGREGKPFFRPHPSKPVSGGTDGMQPSDEYLPYTYAWTPDGWLGAYPSDEEDEEGQERESVKPRFMPLLALIHDYHRRMYEKCQPGENLSPGMLQCANHCNHAIRTLHNLLPPELMPADPQHPANRMMKPPG